jgi:uncharacterized protein YgiM (DUF1202 family)
MHARSVFSFTIICVIAALALSACSPLKSVLGIKAATPDQKLVETAVAQTLEAQNATLTAQATASAVLMPSLPTQPAPPASTQAPELPGLTQAPQIPSLTQPPQGPLPPQPPVAATQLPPAPLNAPTVSASKDTNCRMGPGPDYPVVSALMNGQSSTAMGRNSDSSWWFIQDPRHSDAFCWVWSGTTSVQGDASSLSVINPPPGIPELPQIPGLPPLPPLP